MSGDESVDGDDAGDALGMHRGVKIRELDAAAEAGDEDLAAAGFFGDEFRGRVDVSFEKIVAPSRKLGQIALRRLRRNEMRAIVQRPHVDVVRGEINLERIARILERNFAIHVGAGQVEHDRVGMRGRIRSLGHAMECDLVEWRFADGRLVGPLANSRRRKKSRRNEGAAMGRADGLKIGG